MENIDSYLSEIQKAFSHGNATEHTYRPFLQTLIESFDKEITAINEPKRRTFGATDFVIRKRDIPLGYIEAKDVGKNLDKLNKTEKAQMKRYLEALSNIIYTDHLEFRWFVRGELVQTVSIAEIENGKIKPLADNYEKLSNLFSEFLIKELDTVGSAKELAKRMASTTRLIRQTIEKALEDDSDRSEDSLFGQYKSFQKTLLPNLKQDEFADLYSQTIAYGLFTARCYDNNKPFTRKKASYAIPKTNPFLRNIFDRIGGINLDERIVWAVDDLAELLNRTDISAILQDFGKRTRQEDPVVHFYETFLAEYDQKLRETRGVYYTPEPVVSYIVRSVDKVLQNDFGLSKGLADSSKLEDGTHKVLILDPATGTGTFLYNVIKHIAKRFENNKGMWDGYVSENLLPRIFGFELLVAPYAVAHLKLGLLLEETGYDLDKDERLQIYLNNTLDFATLREDADAFSAFINEEASKGREIQQDKPVMAILGNPPYSGHSSNTGVWINDLLRGSDSFNEQPTENYFEVDGKPLGERNPKWLNDDYVKFIRFSQWRIDQTGYGILGFVTNHGYLDNPTFRGMRQSLMNSFDEIYLLDLHGNAKKKEKSPDGSKDENVFDIQQGVSIGIFIKKKSEVQTGVQASLLAMSAKHEKPVADEKVEDETDTPSADGVASRMLALPTAKVFHKHLYGVRETYTKNANDEKELTGGKYKYLNENDISTTDWTEITPNKPFYLFIPQDETLRKEYNAYQKITEVMPINNVGIVTSRDKFVVDFEKDDLKKRISEFADLSKSDSETRNKFLTQKDKLKLSKVRKEISKVSLNEYLTKCLYRPFDIRHMFYHEAVIERSRSEVMTHFLKGKNLGLAIGRAGQVIGQDEWNILFVSNGITEFNLFRRGGNNLFPLYLYPTEKQTLFDEERMSKEPNLSSEFIGGLFRKLKESFESTKMDDLPKKNSPHFGSKDKLSISPEDMFYYIYAIFHSPTYRSRYAEFLKIDFPRVPITSSYPLFWTLARLGEKLVDLHLLEKAISTEVTFPVKGSNIVEFSPKFVLDKETRGQGDAEREKSKIQNPKSKIGRVHINKEQYFAGVPEDAWNFHIGGYQVLHKWLKDRKDRELSFDDLEHYEQVVSALIQTIELMQNIDETIEEYGGFPIN